MPTTARDTYGELARMNGVTMRFRVGGLCVLAAMALTAACGGSGGGSKAATAVPRTSASAASGQVRADAYAAMPVLPKVNFAQMLGLQPIPGDETHALLLTKDGKVRRVSMTDDAEDPTDFLDISDRIIKNPGQEEGLLGLAYAPDYATSRTFYLYFSAGDPRRQVISRFTAGGGAGDAGSEHVLLEIMDPFSNHNGGAMAFGADGYLYLGEGDGGSGGDPNGNGQNTNALLGKILRLDVSSTDYAIPSDNPFANGGGKPEVYAYGLRNPWRFNFDRATGRLWVADVGQDDWEEIDDVTKGGNYGWNTMEGSHCFSPKDGCNMQGLILPRAEYNHENGNCSVTGGYVYRGKAVPELVGYYVYGDFCSGKVWAFDTSSGDSPPVQLMDTDLSITSFAQDKDGELYLVSFDKRIAKLARK